MDEMQSVSTAIEEASSTIAPLTAEQAQELDDELAALLAEATAEDKVNTSSNTIPLFKGSVAMLPSPPPLSIVVGRDTLLGEEKANNDKKESVLIVS
jgi:hypothetical protein